MQRALLPHRCRGSPERWLVPSGELWGGGKQGLESARIQFWGLGLHRHCVGQDAHSAHRPWFAPLTNCCLPLLKAVLHRDSMCSSVLREATLNAEAARIRCCMSVRRHPCGHLTWLLVRRARVFSAACAPVRSRMEGAPGQVRRAGCKYGGLGQQPRVLDSAVRSNRLWQDSGCCTFFLANSACLLVIHSTYRQTAGW